VETILLDYSAQLNKTTLWANVLKKLGVASLKVACFRGIKSLRGIMDAFDADFLFEALGDGDLPENLRREVYEALQDVPLMGTGLKPDRQGIAAAHLMRFRSVFRDRLHLIEQAGAFDSLLNGNVNWKSIASQAA
jgi:hypothetical protein